MGDTEVRIRPGLWQDDTDGVVLAWIAPQGSFVKAGDVIIEITVEKGQYEIAAPVSGRLHHRIAEEALVRPGDLIGIISAAA